MANTEEKELSLIEQLSIEAVLVFREEYPDGCKKSFLAGVKAGMQILIDMAMESELNAI